MIELKNICKNYETGIAALKNINLTIQDGEIFGIIGQSGAGKSTLIRCINMLETPTSGQIIINGKDLTTLSATELRKERRQIGMIFQHFNLLSNRTVYENIAFGLRIKKMQEGIINEKVKEMLRLVNLKGYEKRSILSLSGGQQQRIAIARAVLRDAPILLLDEATSALDVTTERKVLRNIIKQRPNKTCIVTTHRPSVLNMCQRVYRVMETQVTELSEEESSKMAMDF